MGWKIITPTRKDKAFEVLAYQQILSCASSDRPHELMRPNTLLLLGHPVQFVPMAANPEPAIASSMTS